MSRQFLRASALLFVLSLISTATSALSAQPPKKTPKFEDDPFGPPAGNDDVRSFGVDNAPAASRQANPSNSDDGEDLFGDPIQKPTKPRRAAKPAASPATKRSAGKTVKGNAALQPKAPLKLHGGEKAIMKALKQGATFEYVEVPLKEVLDDISATYRIPIYLDTAGIKDSGICDTTLVTCNLSDISLQSALETVLDELQLTWTIHHEMLYITSPAKAESDDLMYTKMYDVTDLIMPIPMDETSLYNPLTLPNSIISDPTASTTGDPFGAPVRVWPSGAAYRRHSSIGPQLPPYYRGSVDFQPLQDAITNTLLQKSWLDNGGTGTISNLPPGYLIVCQTRELHQKIEDFLTKLRARQRAIPVFKTELKWLWLDKSHRDSLFGSAERGAGNGSGDSIESARLSKIEDEVPVFRAQLSSINGQMTHWCAGDRRAVIVNAVPPGRRGMGYTPIIVMPNVGIEAGVIALSLPGERSARLSVSSIITRWTPARSPVMVGASWSSAKNASVHAFLPAANAPAADKQLSGAIGGPLPGTAAPLTGALHGSLTSHGPGSSSCPIDLPVMPTQQFGTTLRVTLGKPVVVGSLTFAPDGDAGLGAAKKDAVEVYLIATTSLVKKASKAKR